MQIVRFMTYLFNSGQRDMTFVNKAICSSKELAPPTDELETWKETALLPILTQRCLQW